MIAVGSVDKRGDFADTSATGEEIDLVAPGELVRSTGMFDSELVASGTSLAAPQVAGAAALILEKAYAVRVLFTLDDGSLILFDPQSGETPVKEGTVRLAYVPKSIGNC